MKKVYIILFSLLMALKMTPAIAEKPVIEVYKSPSCGCCSDWASHLEQNGFKVISHNEENMSAVKSKLNIPGELRSCHTAVVDGHFIEGHVPARDIKRLLSTKTDIKGLSVPGMPAGTNVPGMETTNRKASFDVIAVGDDGTEIYTRYE